MNDNFLKKDTPGERHIGLEMLAIGENGYGLFGCIKPNGNGGYMCESDTESLAVVAHVYRPCEPNTLHIEKPDENSNGYFKVYYNELKSSELGFDEALGLCASVLIPKKRPCLHWLKTDEQHKAIEDYYSKPNLPEKCAACGEESEMSLINELCERCRKK